MDDFAAAFIRLEGDIILDFRISWAMHLDTPGDTVLLGTKAALRIPSTECWNGSVGGPMTLYTTWQASRLRPKSPSSGMKAACLTRRSAHSWTHIRRQPPVPSSQILYNQAIIDGIGDSAKLGREVDVYIPEV